MIRLYLYFYRKIFWINLILSVLLATAGPGLEIPFHIAFPMIFMTAGYGMTALGVSFMERRTTYLYYNKGTSSFKLYGTAFGINVLVTALLTGGILIWTW